MINYPTSLLLVCGTLLLTACASSPSFFAYPNTQQLIEQHRYQQAIDQIMAKTPIDQVLLLKVKKLAEAQRQQQIKKISLLIKQKKWGQARESLAQLHDKQPKLASFSRLKLLIDNAQLEEERLINTQQALLEANLLNIKFMQQDLSDRIHHHRLTWFSNSKSLMAQQQQLAEKLLHLSTQALIVKDYKNAQKTYEKAIELDHKLGAGEITQAINEGLSHQNNVAINERQNSLIKQLKSAISKLNFDDILKIQAILSNEPFHGSEVEDVLIRAKKTRQQHALKLDAMASKEYRNGNISMAVTQWQQALKLTPAEISIQEKLIRALKVQHKLEELTPSEE